MQLSPALQAEVARRAAGLAAVVRVVLFGSRARGDAAERADVDLAVEAPLAGAVEWSEVVEALDGLPTMLPVDVVRLEALPEAMRRRIEAEGHVLYER